MSVLLAIGCGDDAEGPLPSVPRGIPNEFLLDLRPAAEPSIVSEIPDFLLEELIYLGWDEHSPVYHKFDSSGNLIISLSTSLFDGRYGPLQRVISFDEAARQRDQDLIDLLHKLQSLGDSTAAKE